MGAACCVAAREKTIQPGFHAEIPHHHRNNFRHHSPTWSFRWDSRVGVAGEETSLTWHADLAARNDALDAKSATDVSVQVSDGGSSLESYPIGAWRKSFPNQEGSKSLRTSSSGQAVGRDASEESFQVKLATESSQVSNPVPFKRSPSINSTPSVQSLSPLSSSQSHLHPPSSTPTRWPPVSPGNSDLEGPTTADSARGSYAFSELTSMSQGARWSFDSESCSFSHDKPGWNSTSISMDFQTCKICSKVLSERSVLSSQKIIPGSNNNNSELSVVAVLICGHLYHAECLEAITPETGKYDPDCPVCTFGEKQTSKLCEKMVKAERDFKAKLYFKKSRSRVLDTNYESLDFDGSWKSGGSPVREGGRGTHKLGMSSSLKLSGAKPFLKRHFSFGSGRSGSKAGPGSSGGKKKGLFWAKSSSSKQ